MEIFLQSIIALLLMLLTIIIGTIIIEKIIKFLKQVYNLAIDSYKPVNRLNREYKSTQDSRIRV